jgi:hypothetical protein
MTTIKLKNGSGAPTAGDLVQGEPALDLTNKRLYTEDSGGTVIEVGTNPGTDVTFADNRKALFGAGSDLQIYSDGTNSYIQEGSGTSGIRITSDNQVAIRKHDDEDIAVFNVDGAVRFYHDNAQKFSTTSTGIDVTGTITFDGGTTSADINFGDNDKAIFGAGSDLQIYHDGSHSYIVDAGTGNMYLSTNGNGIVMQASLSETMFSALPNGSVRLYHDNSQKLETTSTGIDVTGSVTADGGTFDGAVLMNSSNELQFFNTNYGIRASTGLEIKTGDFTRFLEGSTEHMRIASGGNVGIKTSSPSTTLDVNGTVSADVFISADNNTDNTNKIATFLSRQYDSGTETEGFLVFQTFANSSGNRIDIGGGTSAYNCATAITFNTAGNTTTRTGTERMRINSSGNVGIGLNNPTAPLTVNGNSNGLLAEFGGNNSVPTRRLQLNEYVVSGINNSGFEFNAPGAGGFAAISFATLGNEAMRIDSSGNLLVGTTTTTAGNEGMVYFNGSSLRVTRDSDEPLNLDRLTSDGTIAAFKKDGTTVGSIFSYNGFLGIGSPSGNDAYVIMGSDFVAPATSTGTARDGAIDLGASGRRFKDIYATNGTIQTSDRNEKQDIEELSEAEQRVAVACKGLLRKFRWKDAVEEKGDDARIHFGIIAQDLQDAFTAEGLNAGRYGMFINSTWTDEETGEEQSRMGVRYSELLAFIISAI